MHCPSQVLLQQFLQADLGEPEQSSVESHVGSCSDCLERLDALTSGQVASEEAATDKDGCPATNDPATREVWSDALLGRLTDGVIQAAGNGGPVPSVQSPVTISDYELLEVVGRGGMGIVYRARQLKLNRIVAVKMIAAHDLGKASLRNRFRVEAESAARLDHAGIVPIHDVGEIGPYVYFSMAFVAGGTLSRKLGVAWEPDKAASILKQIAEAAHFAHGRGIIHRDLKPSNILIEPSGQPKIADFGLAKQIESGAELTTSGEVLGTPSYMPPEQAEGRLKDVSVTSDVYSLGAILYHLLTGRAPFVGEDQVGILYKVIHSEPIAPRQLNGAVPRDLETITIKCLSKSPRDRYPTAGELADDLGRFLAGQPIEAHPVGVSGRLWRWSRRHPALAGLSLALILVLATASVVSGYLARVANDRSDRLTTANQDLTAAEAEARQSADQAAKEAEQSRIQADATMRVMESMLYDIQHVITNNPAEQEERRTLLKSVLTELEDLGEQHVSNRRLTRCRASAILGLADVVLQLGDQQGQGGATGSRRLYLQAIDLFQSLDDQFDDDTTASDLADALTEYGDTLAEEGQWKSANELFHRALPHRERAVRLKADDPAELGKLAELEIFCGEGLNHTGRRAAGLEMFKAARTRCVTILDRVPGDKFIRGEYSHACQKIGDWHVQSGQFNEARTAFLEMKQTLESLLVEFPFDTRCQMDLSTAYERLGDMEGKNGNPQQAYANYQQSLQRALKVGVSAPANDLIQWQVSFGYQKVADAALAVGEIEPAYEAALKCVEIRSRLARSDPENGHLHAKLVHAARSLARADARQPHGEEVKSALKECLVRLATFAERTKNKRFEGDVAWLEQRVSAINTGVAGQ